MRGLDRLRDADNLSAKQRLRTVNYRARYGAYADALQKMDRQIVDMQRMVRSMRGCRCHD